MRGFAHLAHFRSAPLPRSNDGMCHNCPPETHGIGYIIMLGVAVLLVSTFVVLFWLLIAKESAR